MSRLPKRPLFYIVALLLVFLVALAIFLTKAVTSQELQEAMEEKRERAASVDNGEVKMPGIPPVETGVMAEAPIDPYLKELVAPLNGPEGTPEEDLGIVKEVLRQYRRMQNGNPEGLNEDITAALVGGNPNGAIAFPADHSAIRDGQMVDRWGTPFWFHPMSATAMEIRSAGPDRELFTDDDYVLGNSGVSDRGNILPD